MKQLLQLHHSHTYMTQVTCHGVSMTASRSLLRRADQKPEKSLALLPVLHSSSAEEHKCVQICVRCPRTLLSLLVQMGPSRVSCQRKLLVSQSKMSRELCSAKNTSAKAGAFTYQLGALTIILQICRRKLSQTLNTWTSTGQRIRSLTDQKDQAA